MSISASAPTSCQAELVNLAEQRPALGQGQAREGGLGRRGGGRPHRVGVADPHAEVWFLEHQPPAGNQPADDPPQQVHAGGYMHEHRSRMDQIERAGRKRAGADVVPDDLDVRGVYLAQEPVCRSVTITRPAGPTTSDSHRVIDPRPPPISRHLAPLPTPNAQCAAWSAGPDVAPATQDGAIRPGRNAGTRSPEPHSQRDHKPRHSSPPAARQPLTQNARQTCPLRTGAGVAQVAGPRPHTMTDQAHAPGHAYPASTGPASQSRSVIAAAGPASGRRHSLTASARILPRCLVILNAGRSPGQPVSKERCR